MRTTIKRSAGDFLLIYDGKLVTGDEGEKREEMEPSTYRYFFQFKGEEMWYVD